MIQPGVYFIGDNIFPIYHILIPKKISPGFCIGIQHRRIWITIDFYQLVNCFSRYSNVSWIKPLGAKRSIQNSIYQRRCYRSVHIRIDLYYSHSHLWWNQRCIRFFLFNLKYGFTVCYIQYVYSDRPSNTRYTSPSITSDAHQSHYFAYVSWLGMDMYKSIFMNLEIFLIFICDPPNSTLKIPKIASKKIFGAI